MPINTCLPFDENPSGIGTSHRGKTSMLSLKALSSHFSTTSLCLSHQLPAAGSYNIGALEVCLQSWVLSPDTNTFSRIQIKWVNVLRSSYVKFYSLLLILLKPLSGFFFLILIFITCHSASCWRAFIRLIIFTSQYAEWRGKFYLFGH